MKQKTTPPIKNIFPFCRRCGNRIKQLPFGYACPNCKALLFGEAVEWREVKMDVKP